MVTYRLGNRDHLSGHGFKGQSFAAACLSEMFTHEIFVIKGPDGLRLIPPTLKTTTFPLQYVHHE